MPLTAPNILAALGGIFLFLGIGKLTTAGPRDLQTRTWLVLGVICVAASVWLFFQPGPPPAP